MTGKLAIGALTLLVGAVSAATAAAPGDAAAGFEKLKSLAGQWEAKGPEGMPVTVTYSVVSEGSAVLEQISFGNMVTVYHRDGDGLMLTHYCAGGNQPRMRAAASKDGGRTYDFRFVDVTNLTDPKATHMRHMSMTFKDADHVAQKWAHVTEGREDPMTLELSRKR